VLVRTCAAPAGVRHLWRSNVCLHQLASPMSAVPTVREEKGEDEEGRGEKLAGGGQRTGEPQASDL